MQRRCHSHVADGACGANAGQFRVYPGNAAWNRPWLVFSQRCCCYNAPLKCSFFSNQWFNALKVIKVTDVSERNIIIFNHRDNSKLWNNKEKQRSSLKLFWEQCWISLDMFGHHLSLGLFMVWHHSLADSLPSEELLCELVKWGDKTLFFCSDHRRLALIW